MLVSLVSKNLVAFTYKVSLMFGWKLFVWSSKTLPPIFRLSLDNYHPNIKFTTELNPSKFLASYSLTSMVPINSMFIVKTQKYLHHGTPKLQKLYAKQNQLLFKTKQKSSNFDEEIPLIKENFIKVDYTLRFIKSVVHQFQKDKDVEIKVL